MRRIIKQETQKNLEIRRGQSGEILSLSCCHRSPKECQASVALVVVSVKARADCFPCSCGRDVTFASAQETIKRIKAIRKKNFIYHSEKFIVVCRIYILKKNLGYCRLVS